MKRYEIRKLLYNFPNDELCEIYDTISNWKWDERLGKIPENFYELPLYTRIGIDKKGITRDTYLRPFCEEIRRIVSEHDLLKYHHLHNLNKTEDEFERWWIRSEIFMDENDYSLKDERSVDGISVHVSIVSAIITSLVVSLLFMIFFQ